MRSHVEFRSDAFPAEPGEEKKINPGRWAMALARYLRSELSARGFPGGEPFFEDWGVCIPVDNKEFPLWVGCGNYDEHPNGFLCFIEPSKQVIRKWFRKVDTSARVSAIGDSLDGALRTHPKISDIRWWDEEGGSGKPTEDCVWTVPSLTLYMPKALLIGLLCGLILTVGTYIWIRHSASDFTKYDAAEYKVWVGGSPAECRVSRAREQAENAVPCGGLVQYFRGRQLPSGTKYYFVDSGMSHHEELMSLVSMMKSSGYPPIGVIGVRISEPAPRDRQ